MSLTFSSLKQALACSLTMLALAAQPVRGQVESFSPEQIAGYQQQLKTEAASAPVEALGRYMAQLGSAPAGSQQSGPRVNEQTLAMVNAVRLSQAIKAANWQSPAKLAWHIVPPLSPLIRLHDRYPIDGQLGAPVRIAAAQDEFEPASFTLYAYENLSNVELKLSALTNERGVAFPASQLDMKVVKVWYQNRNGWYSYFADVGLTLIPELLVNDENLVRVDTQKVANYARLRTESGDKYVWISPPGTIDVPFNHYDPQFHDAETLQPVSLEAGRFKQFFLTAHVTEATEPGIYRGFIQATAQGQTLAQIPVAIRVLPFKLPAPATYFDPSKDMLITMMNSWPRFPASDPAYEPTLRNLRNHNIIHAGPGGTSRLAYFEELIPYVKKHGFATNMLSLRGGIPWIGKHGGAPMLYQELVSAKLNAARWREFMLRHFGHTQGFLTIGDEPPASWIMKIRRVWKIYQEQGLPIALAGHQQVFLKGGYLVDNFAAAGWPFEGEKALQRHLAGHGYISHYAGQHHGPENPDLVRRQHGMLGYLSGFSAVNNYAFYYGPWNDLAYSPYKPMVMAYPTSRGLVDTLAWEGFREGVDDMRYATLLLRMADKAMASDDLELKLAGRKARQWMAQIDGMTMDLHTMRFEMIQQILTLQAAEKAAK